MYVGDGVTRRIGSFNLNDKYHKVGLCLKVIFSDLQAKY